MGLWAFEQLSAWTVLDGLRYISLVTSSIQSYLQIFHDGIMLLVDSFEWSTMESVTLFLFEELMVTFTPIRTCG